MEAVCRACGARLRVNPHLAGAVIPCPGCGAPVSARPPRPPKRAVRPLTARRLGSQAAIAALVLACLAGAAWGGPSWSFLGEHPLLLLAAAVVLCFPLVFARRAPVLSAFFAFLVVVAACTQTVDASRTLALSVSLLAVWLSF